MLKKPDGQGAANFHKRGEEEESRTMEIRTRQYGDVIILAANGRLDADNAQDLVAAINKNVQAGNLRLVADLKGVDFASNDGIQLLVQAAHHIWHQGGDIRLASVQSQVKTILNLIMTDKKIKVYSNAVAATASYFQNEETHNTGLY